MTTAVQKTIFKLLYYSVAFIASLILIKIWFENRSLFLDEVNLAMNLAESSQISHFFEQLNYGQYAPPLFLLLSKVMTLLFGLHEMAVRFIPLIAAIASLIYFKKWLQSHQLKGSQLLIYVLFAFSFLLMKHGTEFKQYMTDAFISIILLYYARQYNSLSSKQIVAWSILGGLVCWLSMSSVFILSGVGLYHLYNSIRQNKQILATTAMIVVWVLSFGLYAWLLLFDAAQSDYLQSYHQHYFLPLPWQEGFGHMLLVVFRAFLGKTAVALAIGIVVFMWGLMYLIRHRPAIAILYISPVIALSVASMLQYYTLLDRLLFFLIPVILVVMAIGLDALINAVPGWSKILILLLFSLAVIAALAQRSNLQYITSPYLVEESRPVLNKLADSLDNDVLILTHGGAPSFRFYTTYYKNKIAISGATVLFLDWENRLLDTCHTLKSQGITEVWIYDAHTFGTVLDKLHGQMNECGQKLTLIEDKSASATKIKLQ